MEQPNLLYINELSKGDEEFKKQVIEVLKEELSGEIECYFLHIKNEDLKKTKEVVHRIKHKMSILGLEKSYKITNDFENNLADNSVENKEYFENVLPIMLDFLKII
ncbi:MULTISPECIES: histidine kinase [Tenacibaculum]|uniref:Histidine kinase n=2 Tax=Tenacibaculum TaxID=104267 RepID=A0A2G1BRG8_9FLAO|nr:MULTISPECIES: histidine kinase [Tenacibaculum]AZJ36038.1 Hpt domain-containing protein [Tenacibaculum singaporense]MDP2542113.1 Hpt domain-containing protein [Tenacibaculum discolor]PHN96617.1 histidine kinase [Tenacibaculum discolor]RSC93686.1 Hpt domain-containing protein [Tenacibaculum singaporense]